MKSAVCTSLLFLAAVLLTCTASAAKKFEPITVIIKASPEAVKAAAVTQAVAEGYAIEQEGQFQIVFQKNMTGAGGFFTAVLLSPPACASFSPRWIFTVLFVPGPAGVTVTTHTEQEHADTLCRPARQNLDKDSARHVTKFLELVQGKAEQMQQSVAPKPEAAPTAPPAVVPAAVPATPASPPPQTTTTQPPIHPQPTVTPVAADPQDQSLGEIARRARAKKAKQEADPAVKKEE
jgi:hypothetical protein